MKPLSLLLLLLLLLPSALLAQEDNFIAQMEAALQLHGPGASDLDSEFKAVEQFDALSKAYPEAWQPDFWAAYVLTQIVRSKELEKEKGIEAINQAEIHLDRAIARAAEKTTRNLADFYILQVLTYRFKAQILGAEGKEEEQEEYAAKQKALHQQAVLANPESPVVMVFVALDLQREGEMPKLLAARALLDGAQEAFAQARPERSMTTHFNSEWLPVWRPRIAEKIRMGRQQPFVDPPPGEWDSVTDVLRGHEWPDQINNLINAVAAMPSSSFGFRPKEVMMTFGEVVEHIANVQYYFCDNLVAMVTGRTSPERDAPQTENKDSTTRFLMDAIATCDIVFDHMTDELLVAQRGRAADNMTTMMGHTRRETGKLVTYLRLVDVTPPEIQYFEGRKWRTQGGVLQPE